MEAIAVTLQAIALALSPHNHKRDAERLRSALRIAHGNLDCLLRQVCAKNQEIDNLKHEVARAKGLHIPFAPPVIVEQDEGSGGERYDVASLEPARSALGLSLDRRGW